MLTRIRCLRISAACTARVAAAVVPIAFCLSGCASPDVNKSRRMRSAPSASGHANKSLAQIGNRLRSRYKDAKYITFDAEIVQHEGLAPGYVIVPGRGIPPGAVFHVLMSRRGDVRADLTIGDELVYSFQVSANCPNAGVETDDNCTYTLREYNHRDRIASAPLVQKTIPHDVSLIGTFLSATTSCASGGVLLSHIGNRGRFIQRRDPNDVPEADRVAGGTLIGRQRVNGVNAVVAAYEQRAATCNHTPDDSPGNEIPGITWHYTVGERSGILLRKETFLVPCTGDPIRIRKVHYENVAFPERIDSSAVFSQRLADTEGYRAWSAPGSTQAIPGSENTK